MSSSTLADYDYWAQVPAITVYELAVLLTGEDPRSEELDRDWSQNFDRVERAAVSEVLPLLPDPYSDCAKRYPRLPAIAGRYIRRVDIVEWARSAVPWLAECLSAPEDPVSSEAREPALWLDRKHPHYSEAVVVVIKAWNAVCGPGEPLVGRSAKTKIRKYIDDNFPQLSAEARKRISVVVNPDTAKKGGAPKSST